MTLSYKAVEETLIYPLPGRAWLDVSVAALRENAAELQRHAGLPLIPMVKANAYGVGVSGVVAALETLSPMAYGVASVAEGEQLRELGITRQVIVFTPVLEAEYERAAGAHLTLALGDAAAIAAWSRTGRPYHLAIDTGMNRAGLPWRETAGLGDGVVVVYSGTLGLKHDPEVLVLVAEALARIDPAAVLVVVSEGIGRKHLDLTRSARPELPIVTFDYQPYEALPAVMGSADVLLAVLEEGAGEFSVPSKVLSYLCAGRPILGVMPRVNAAAEVIDEAGAGRVLEPRTVDAAAIEIVLRDLLDPTRRDFYGRSARRYAEQNFDVERKADVFVEAVLGTVGRDNPEGVAQPETLA